MRNQQSRLVVTAALVALIASMGVLPASVEGETTVEKIDTIKVLTDRYADTTSVEGIVKGLVKDGMSDQEKVIAIYHWYRRVIFHHRLMSADRRDLLRAVNSYGCNLCGSQAAVLVMILNKAGFKTRVMLANAKTGFGGHTIVEVFYGDKWHCMDTMTSFFVLNRDDPPTIASLKEMKKDKTLVADAVKENRAPEGFIYCMHNPEITVKDIERIEKMGIVQDRRWATLTFEGGTLLDFWKKGPRRNKVLHTGTYKGKYRPGVLDIVLKPNEEYVRLWDNVGKWIGEPSYDATPPHHTCGRSDEDDPVNFKYYEPYKKKNYGLTKSCYRYHGNGWLEWKPDASAGEIEDAAESIENLAREGQFFKVKAPAGSGVLTVPVKSPYAVVEIEAEIESKGESAPKVTYVFGEKTQAPEPKKNDNGFLEYIQSEQKNPTHSGRRYGAVYEYKVRIEAAGDTSFRLVSLKTTFQLNMYVLPGFFPGKNTVTVSAKSPKNLKDHKLVVAYDWDEGPAWKKARTVTKEIPSLPASYEVDVAGPKMPRMKRLSILLTKQVPVPTTKKKEKPEVKRPTTRKRRSREDQPINNSR